MDDKAQPTQATPPAAAAAQIAKPVFRQPKVGDHVWLHVPPRVNRPAQPLPATIVRVVKGMTVTLKTTEESPDEFEIHKSAFDPTGSKPDGWSFRD